jgi:hypothetical protein
MPQYHDASLGGMKGKGYAEVIHEPGPSDLKRCEGRFVIEDQVGVSAAVLMNRDTVVFEGVVYDHGSRTREKFPVIVTNLQQGSGPGIARFKASGNPYADQE